jgi:GMP synthase PP-ATPase subunit
MLLSGGVDSTVCAALMNRALGVDRVIAIHIDNGFMRKNESDQVRDSLAQLGLDVKGEDQIKKIKNSKPLDNTVIEHLSKLISI